MDKMTNDIADSLVSSIRDLRNFNLKAAPEEIGEITSHIVENLAFVLAKDYKRDAIELIDYINARV